MRIAVLCGGLSTERNVSLKGGFSVHQALVANGHEVISIDPAMGRNCIIDWNVYQIPEVPPTMEELNSVHPAHIIECLITDVFQNIDVAFIVLHGKYGEDGVIQALLDLKKIPYTGSSMRSHSIAIDKNISKLLFLTSGIQTPKWALVKKHDFANSTYIENIKTELGSSIVVKPNEQGSTIGLSILHRAYVEDILDAIKKAGAYDDSVIVEEYIAGRELTVAIFNGQALPIVEIAPKDGYYDYQNKYTAGKTEYHCPADLPEEVTEFIQDQALTAYNLLHCSGFARVDFRITDEYNVYCLEINTIPGFTATSLVPMAAAQVGLNFNQLCEELVNLAISKNN
jgi:D-alanine-D-alanine ligase